MNLIMVPLRLTWNLIKAVKTSILVILVIVSVTLNVAQFTGSALAGMVETAIKSTLGITSVTTKATIRAAKASASVTKLTNQVANLNATTTTSTKMIANLRSKLAKSAATAQVAQRTALTKQKAKLKAQARLKRSLVAVPILGVGLALLFEEQDYREWAEENPDSGRTDYACEVATYSAEVFDEVVADTLEYTKDWSEMLKPDADWVKSKLTIPKCDES